MRHGPTAIAYETLRTICLGLLAGFLTFGLPGLARWAGAAPSSLTWSGAAAAGILLSALMYAYAVGPRPQDVVRRRLARIAAQLPADAADYLRLGKLLIWAFLVAAFFGAAAGMMIWF
jgi:hypothetical protein